MPPKRSASLARRFPRRLDIPFLLVASGVLLGVGITLPALETRTLFFWRDEYSIYMNVMDLSREGRQIAATILAACAIIYPVSKLILLGLFWLFPFPYVWRSRFIRLLRLLGRWSMVDVFAITAIVLGSLTIGPLNASPKIGLFLYSGGIISLMLVSLLMDRLARHGSR